MGLCLNSNLKLPNMWKYTSLLSLVKLDLKLKKVRLSVLPIPRVCKGGGELQTHRKIQTKPGGRRNNESMLSKLKMQLGVL